MGVGMQFISVCDAAIVPALSCPTISALLRAGRVVYRLKYMK
jgi:hypothetical protein